MAREAKAVPPEWKELGRWYVVDVDDNQKNWIEYCALMDDEHRTASEDRRLAELEPVVADQFEVKLIPYSGDEYGKLEVASRKGAFGAKVDAKGKISFRDDPLKVAEELMVDVCSARILAVRGYVRVDSQEVNRETGEVIAWKRTPITKGKDLVEFIRREKWEEEKPVLDDCFKAIKELSHLEKGLKKSFPARSNSSEATTSL